MVGRTTGVAALTLLTVAGSLVAQARPDSTVPRWQGVNFLVARYATTGSASLYAARELGLGMVVAGAVMNARTEYQAVILGAGTRLRLAHGAGVTAILAGCDATDGPSARLYVLPSIAAGRIVATATATALQPLRGGLVRQASINPLTLALRLTPGVRAGLAATVEMAEGRAARIGVGPSAQVRLLRGTLAVELGAVGLRTRTEVRGSFSAAL